MAKEVAWNKLLEGEDLTAMIEDYFRSGEAARDMDAISLYDQEVCPDLDLSGLAVCCECGASCTIEEVIVGHAADTETPCCHSWLSYQHEGYPVLEEE